MVVSFKQRVELINNFYLYWPPRNERDFGNQLFFAIPNENIKSEAWLPEDTRKAFRIKDIADEEASDSGWYISIFNF